MTNQNTWKAIGALVCFLLLIGVGEPIGAQGGDAICPQLVAEALSTLEEICGDLSGNEACYGHNRVDVTFWEAREDLTFAIPADRVPLLDLQTIATAPLDVDSEFWGVAVLRLRANVPEALPGQAVTFLLMGDVTVESAVPPDQVAGPIEPVTVTTALAANLRSRPSTNANVLTSVPAGTELRLVGVNDAGDWYETLVPGGGRGWVFGELLVAGDADALAALPVTFGADVAPRYGPMQAFYFTTGLGELACNEAPDALVVQGPDNLELALNVNGMEMQIGSTIVLMMVEIPTEDGGTQTVMIVALAEGHLTTTVGGVPVNLSQPGQAFALSVSDEGTVDEQSELLDIGDADLAALIEFAYQNAMVTDVFEVPDDQDFDFTFFNPFQTVPPLGPTEEVTEPPFEGTPLPFENTPEVSPLGDCQWPVITSPASGTNFGGGGTQTATFTPVPGAASYVWTITGDGHSFSLGGSTTATNFTFDVGALPGAGRAYWLSVMPLDGSGQPLCPSAGGFTPNAVWFSKEFGATLPTLPPLPIVPTIPTVVPAFCGNMVCEPPAENMFNCTPDCISPFCGNNACEPFEDPYNCPADC